MSSMLELLRRHRTHDRRGPQRESSSRRNRDAVLATLAGPRRGPRAGRLVLVLGTAAAVVAVATAWRLGIWFPTSAGLPDSPRPTVARTPPEEAARRAQPVPPDAGQARVQAPGPSRTETAAPPHVTAPADPVRATARPQPPAKAAAPPPADVPGPGARVPAAARARPPVSAARRETRAAGSAPARTAAISPDARPVAAPLPAAGGGAPAVDRDTTGADHFRLAVYYHQAGDFENALIHYRALLEDQPLNIEAHNNLGLLYQGKGLLDDATREFRKAISIDANYRKAHNNLGVTLLDAGQVDAALVEFRWLQAVDPGNADALVNLAIALRAASRPDEAREALLQAVSINPRQALAHYNLALIYEECREYARAIQHYEAFLRDAGAEHAALAPEVRARVRALRQQEK